MINLIPSKEKKKMNQEFYYRFVVLFLLMISTAVFIGLVALLPSYFISLSKKSSINKELETQKGTATFETNQKILETIETINRKLDIVENKKNDAFIVSEQAIKNVLVKKIAGIKITRIGYEDNTVKGKKVSISGTAPSREVLLSFRQALEQEPSSKI